MNTKKHFRILVVEDSEFFNQLLTNQLKWYAGEIAYHKNINLTVDSYINSEQCLEALRDTDIAFVDYYLEKGKTAMDVIGKIKENNWDCKIIIISRAREVKSSVALLRHVDFLLKDDNALSKSCFITEEIMKTRI